MFISQEDYILAGKPKFNAMYFFGAYAAVCGVINHKFTQNPERFYKGFLFTPMSVVFGLLPIFAGAYFIR